MDKELLIKAIKLKMQLSKRAPKKFYGIHRRTSLDQRIYNSFLFSRATTGRWASVGVNFQNIKRPEFKDVNLIIAFLRHRGYRLLEMMWGDTVKALSATVRGMIVAKSGYELFVSDFFSIESRVLAWLAGEEVKLEIFRTHGKIYEYLAAQIFNIPMESVLDGSDERFGGKISELACGFQGSWSALQAMARQYNVDLADDFCQEVVTKWRKSNPNIVKYWAALQDAAVKAIQNPGQEFLVADQLETPNAKLPAVKYMVWKNYLCCKLPSGRILYYANPTLKTRTITMFKVPGEFPRTVVYNYKKWTVNEFYAEAKKHGVEVKSFEVNSIRFWGLNSETHQWVQQYAYGGSLCLSGHTKVLTNSGIKLLIDVKLTDTLWDGVNWVKHEGLAFNGVCATISLDGLHMTEGHEILTDRGWKSASQSEGYNWAKVKFPEGTTLHRFQWEKIFMGNRMYSVWKNFSNARKRIYENATNFLWVHDFKINISSKDENKSSILAPPLQSVAVDGSQMHEQKLSSMGKLWWSRNRSMRKMGKVISRIFRRYGVDVQERYDFRQEEQRERLLQGQLPVGNMDSTIQQSKNKRIYRHSEGKNDCLNGGPNIWREKHNPFVSHQKQSSSKISIQKGKCEEPVYDIMNSGPLKRFTVIGDKGLRLVHNCENVTQAVARDLLGEGMLRVSKAGYIIIMHVHDEIVVEIEKGIGNIKDFDRLVSVNPVWCPDLPIGAKGYAADRYRK